MAMTTPFAHRTCRSCKGSGTHQVSSRAHVAPERCMNCGGRGHKLTAKGAMAHQRFARSLSVPASEIKVGDIILLDEDVRWLTVQAATTDKDNPGCVKFDLTWVGDPSKACGYGTPATSWIRLARTKEEKAALLEAALVYQASL